VDANGRLTAVTVGDAFTALTQSPSPDVEVDGSAAPAPSGGIFLADKTLRIFTGGSGSSGGSGSGGTLTLTGQVQAGQQATTGGNGELLFPLDTGLALSSPLPLITDVTVFTSTPMELVTITGTTTLTPTAALSALNTAPTSVTVEGFLDPATGEFFATHKLSIAP
jgi:hypothetical protein